MQPTQYFMKKICVLTAGGTIGMVPHPLTGSLEPAKDPMSFLKQMPDISKIADVNLKLVMNIDSSNMGPTEWTQIADEIKQNYNQYDGFVVVQGTDTMAYTASAMSYAFQNLNKPIVFTGSLLPAFEPGSDAINNLIYAIMTATQDIAEVCLVFSNKILRGNRSKKYHESFLVGFHSPVFPAIGELGRPIHLNEWRFKKSKLKKLKYSPKFSSKVGLVKLYPGFNPAQLDYYIQNKYKAVFIEAFGSGNVPFLNNSIVPHIKKLLKKDVVVVIGNQMEKGKTNLGAYQAGQIALESGACSNFDMTTEATMTKLMWLVENCKSSSEIQKRFKASLAGEVSI